jgi:riboflavin biosynthesis pyrimidine reductase
MPVVATLVVGADGSTSKGGNSRGVASNADRQAFLARRRGADCIVIGGQTARVEPYARTPVPVVVISRSMINALAHNRLAHWWNLSPAQAIAKAHAKFGENIFVEAGASVVLSMLEERLIDQFELSVTDIQGGEDPIDIEKILHYFSKVEKTVIDETIFYSASEPKPLKN